MAMTALSAVQFEELTSYLSGVYEGLVAKHLFNPDVGVEQLTPGDVEQAVDFGQARLAAVLYARLTAAQGELV